MKWAESRYQGKLDGAVMATAIVGLFNQMKQITSSIELPESVSLPYFFCDLYPWFFNFVIYLSSCNMLQYYKYNFSIIKSYIFLKINLSFTSSRVNRCTLFIYVMKWKVWGWKHHTDKHLHSYGCFDGHTNIICIENVDHFHTYNRGLVIRTGGRKK